MTATTRLRWTRATGERVVVNLEPRARGAVRLSLAVDGDPKPTLEFQNEAQARRYLDAWKAMEDRL